MKIKLKKGDTVAVIAGKDKGKQGKILEVLTKTGQVLVENVNQVKRHSKPSQKNPQGGILLKSLPIHVSNVMILDPKTNKPSRIKMKKSKDGYTRVAMSGTELK